MLNKKYTMEEFKEKFKEAEKKALDAIINDEKFNEKKDPMFLMTVSLTTMLGISKLKEILFEEETTNE